MGLGIMSRIFTKSKFHISGTLGPNYATYVRNAKNRFPLKLEEIKKENGHLEAMFG